MILFCGDPHGRFDHIRRAVKDLPHAAIVLLGDMAPARPLHEELEPILDRVWFIHGNHDADSDELWTRVWDSRLADRNLHGRVVTLSDGTRVAGLGGVFRGAVWYPREFGEPQFRTRVEHVKATPRQHRWRGSVPRKHWSTIYPEDIDRLAALRADILVTHEAPGYHPNGFETLDALARSMGAKVVVHGHHHESLDSSARWVAQGFKTFGVGLRGITAIDVDGDVHVVVTADVDERRRDAMPAAGRA